MAINDLLKAVEYFSDKNIDLLVIIRGGGSLMARQSFVWTCLPNGVDPADLSKLLEQLRHKAPDVYRHIVGVIRAILAL